jgi:thiol-disulfide isomerase/thioredoxin
LKFIASIAVCLLLIGCGERVDPRVGTDMSQLTFTSDSGEIVSLEQYKGKPTVINLWATWCAPCIHEMPSLMALQEKYQIILISLDMKQSTAQKMLKKHGIKPNISLWDERGKSVREHLSALHLPQTFIVDSNMVIRGVEIGDRDWVSTEMLGRINKVLQ